VQEAPLLLLVPLGLLAWASSQPPRLAIPSPVGFAVVAILAIAAVPIGASTVLTSHRDEPIAYAGGAADNVDTGLPDQHPRRSDVQAFLNAS